MKAGNPNDRIQKGRVVRTLLGKVRGWERNVSYVLEIPPDWQLCVILTPALGLQNVSEQKGMEETSPASQQAGEDSEGRAGEQWKPPVG